MATTGQQAGKIVPRIFPIASDEGITIAGMRGQGKTTFAKRTLSRFNKVLVWDPLAQYPEFNRYVPQTGHRQNLNMSLPGYGMRAISCLQSRSASDG
jgi:hypothetical protein